MIQRIMVPGILEPVSHYCHVVRAGPHVWVSGAVGMEATARCPTGRWRSSTWRWTSSTAAWPPPAPAHQVVKVQLFLTDMADRAAINPRRIAYFGDHRPASTLVEVTALVDPRLKVEIECQAFVAAGRGRLS